MSIQSRRLGETVQKARMKKRARSTLEGILPRKRRLQALRSVWGCGVWTASDLPTTLVGTTKESSEGLLDTLPKNQFGAREQNGDDAGASC